MTSPADPSSALTPAVVRAPAKLTVSLRVTGVRDDGYHLIDAEMVSLDVADTLTFTAGDGMTVSGPFARGVPTDERNLVVKALRAIGQRARVAVDKQIPAGGGLGGGSTDAAAVLRWAGVDDLALAASLGADVPFCVVGGRARVTGIGEVLEPLPYKARWCTLVVPPFGVSTPAVYRAWDELGGPRGDVNDLEPAALVVEPRLATWRDRIRDAFGSTPVLAGSGATWFVSHDTALDERTLDDVRAALRPAEVLPARTIPALPPIEPMTGTADGT